MPPTLFRIWDILVNKTKSFALTEFTFHQRIYTKNTINYIIEGSKIYRKKDEVRIGVGGQFATILNTVVVLASLRN